MIHRFYRMQRYSLVLFIVFDSFFFFPVFKYHKQDLVPGSHDGHGTGPTSLLVDFPKKKQKVVHFNSVVVMDFLIASCLMVPVACPFGVYVLDYTKEKTYSQILFVYVDEAIWPSLNL